MGKKKINKRIIPKSSSHSKLSLLCGVIAILIFPFVLLYLGRLGKSFLKLLTTNSPSYSDLLAYYGVALTVFFSFQLYRKQRNDDLQDHETAFLQNVMPSLSITLEEIGDNEFNLEIFNRKQTPCIIEQFCQEHVNAVILPGHSLQKRVCFHKSNPDEPDCICVCYGTVEYQQRHPKEVFVTVLDESNNLWEFHCLEQAADSDRYYYFLNVAHLIATAQIKKI